MKLARLRVDEVGGERACVAAEEDVRERGVAPEEAGEVDPNQKLGPCVEERVAELGDVAAREERSKGQRVVEVSRDEDRIEIGSALADDADDLDDGHLVRCEGAQKAVLLAGEPHRQLLQRVEPAVVLDEAHHVAMDSRDHVDQALMRPALERALPGEVEEVGMARSREELEARGHARSLPGRARYFCSSLPSAKTPWSCVLSLRRLSSISACA